MVFLQAFSNVYATHAVSNNGAVMLLLISEYIHSVV